MSRNGKVIVAMSGGVDSSVSACLLKEQGYECVGVFMCVGGPAGTQGRRGEGTEERRLRHGCCSPTDQADARQICGRLGMPFHVLNLQSQFDRIIDYFVDEYANARTPNPCVMCNTWVKFGTLLEHADRVGAEFVATGHYARVVHGVGTWGGGDVGRWEGTTPLPSREGLGEGNARDDATRCPPVVSPERGDGATPLPFREGLGEGNARDDATRCPPVVSPEREDGVYLARSLNLAKDQSYVLFGIRRENLARCLFPVGEIADKAVVRDSAARIGLRVHDKPDSQEICFVPDNDYKELVRARRPETQRPGEVRDVDGQVLGTHDGVANFTIGQRRGLGIAAGEPIYVTRLNVLDNTVTVGPRADLLSSGLVADRVNWLVGPPAVDVWQSAAIKIRYQHSPAPGRFQRRVDGRLAVEFDTPQSAVTPGQAAVLYTAEGVVIGGGWIDAAVAVEA